MPEKAHTINDQNIKIIFISVIYLRLFCLGFGLFAQI